jgi:hypothetical protein
MGVFVQPRQGRCIIMDQDVLHRVNCPSRLAPQPRYSFVEKACTDRLARAGRAVRVAGCA